MYIIYNIQRKEVRVNKTKQRYKLFRREGVRPVFAFLLAPCPNVLCCMAVWSLVFTLSLPLLLVMAVVLPFFTEETIFTTMEQILKSSHGDMIHYTRQVHREE